MIRGAILDRMIVGEVSPYPPLSVLHSGSIAFYAKNLAIHLRKLDVGVVCFADGAADDYFEDGVRVVRCWRKGITYPFSIFSQISKNLGTVQLIHIQQEYYMYGNEISAALFPSMLLLLKFLRRPIVVTLHSALPLVEINKSFAEENSLKGSPFILKGGLLLVTKLIGLFSKRIIVHEKVLEERLLSSIESH